VFKIVNDTRTKQDLVVDYNGYQIERTTGEQRLIRGRLTRIDSEGALVRRDVRQQVQPRPLKPVIRDAKGNVVAQDQPAHAAPKLRKPGEPVTRTEFIRFIQSQAQPDKGAQK
jgi:hypothetical protein